MKITPADLVFFWSAAWSVPLRSACRWLTPDAQTAVAPDAIAARWLKPLCLQRWVGQAIGDRLAWMRQHPEAAAYRCWQESTPCWTGMSAVSYDRRCLRELSEAGLLSLWEVEVERLLRISEAPPARVGEDDWARAALGVCEHLSQLYAELKRREQSRRARWRLREALRGYVRWDYRAAA
jgi:hypothetical protein